MATNATNSTAAAYSYLTTSANRFSGLVSGMDIESIMEKLMKAESAKMEKLQQQKQKIEWQRDAYRGVNTKMEAFRTEALDKYKPSTFLTKSATSSDSSKVGVTATSSANGNLSISSVSQLASAATVKSSSPVTVMVDGQSQNMSKTTTMGQLLGESAFSSSATKTFTLDVYKNTGDTTKTTISVEFSATDTVESFAKKLNAQGGVTAVVGSNGEFSITSNATGEYTGGTIQYGSANADDTKELLSKFKISYEGAGKLTNGQGENAVYTMNGIEMQSQKNTFNELGYNITLKTKFDSNSSPVTINSSLDTDAVVNQVKSFVELYNGLIESLNSPTKEKIDYNYKPLTDAQKAEMNEAEIKKWEDAAKKGLLRNDKAVSKVVSDMRASIYSISTTKDSKYNSLFNIGITSSKDYMSGGKLEINEDKLREAIEANPEAVADLFTRSAATNGTNDQGGLIDQARKIAKTGIDSIADKAGKEGATEGSYTLGKNLATVNTQIDDWKKKLKKIEERYYKQFSAMETAIQKANSQSSIFSG